MEPSPRCQLALLCLADRLTQHFCAIHKKKLTLENHKAVELKTCPAKHESTCLLFSTGSISLHHSPGKAGVGER